MRRLLSASLAVLALATTAPVLASAASPPAAKAIAFDSAPDFLKLPEGLYLGEAAGVATNSKGHIFVFTRTGNTTLILGGSRAFATGGSRLFEFDQNGAYVREIGQGIYGFMSGHVVRVDPQDNIWAVDETANVVIKFDPEGRVLMVLGRKPEAINVPTKPGAPGTGLGVPGDTFNGPADVGWDAQGDIFVADGTRNARVVKLNKDGDFIKAWGGRGKGPGQFSQLHTLAVDAKGNVYVGDRGNDRIQVFDNDGNYKREITGVGSPVAICISGGAHQYLYSSNSNNELDLDHGEIYKMELSGKVLGQFGKAGHMMKEFNSLHSIDCRDPNTLLVAEIGNWRVQKLTLKPR